MENTSQKYVESHINLFPIKNSFFDGFKNAISDLRKRTQTFLETIQKLWTLTFIVATFSGVFVLTGFDLIELSRALVFFAVCNLFKLKNSSLELFKIGDKFADFIGSVNNLVNKNSVM